MSSTQKFFADLSSSNIFNHEKPLGFSQSIHLENIQINDLLLENNTSTDNIISEVSDNFLIEEEEEKSKEMNEKNYLFSSIILDDKIGTYIMDNKIKIIKEIGKGGQGTVYLGLIEEMETEVCVKFYNLNNKNIIKTVERQLDFLKELEHDNIVCYHDYERNETETGIEIHIIMEYFEMDLPHFLERYKNEKKLKYLPLNLVANISRQILSGINYLHKNKIIHRDLKPENILLNYDEKIMKISDFGTSLQIKKNENTIMKRSILGTINYMSPETIFGKKCGYDCDIWSFGCIVYYLVSGYDPYVNFEEDKPKLKDYQICFISNPLETADDNILDIFYHRDNRVLLDFIHKCWRGNISYRPNAEELLNHPFLNGYYDNK